MNKSYSVIVGELLVKIEKTQSENIAAAAEIVARTIVNDGLIYIFGCGHSHIIAEDSFYRAGGLANVYPVFCSALMLHVGASRSSVLEKDENNAKGLLDKYKFSENDCFVVISTSGINGVPIETALEAKRKGLPVIAIYSSAYSAEKSHHSSGKKLSEVADVAVDNLVPHGDAVIKLDGCDAATGAVSTALSCSVMQAITLKAEEISLSRGIKPSVFVSGNVEGGAEYNREILKRYKGRIDEL